LNHGDTESTEEAQDYKNGTESHFLAF